MSVKDEKRMTTTEMRMVPWAMGVSLLEHHRNEDILEEARVESIAMVMRRMEWLRHVKRRDETFLWLLLTTRRAAFSSYRGVPGDAIRQSRGARATALYMEHSDKPTAVE